MMRTGFLDALREAARTGVIAPPAPPETLRDQLEASLEERSVPVQVPTGPQSPARRASGGTGVQSPSAAAGVPEHPPSLGARARTARSVPRTEGRTEGRKGTIEEVLDGEEHAAQAAAPAAAARQDQAPAQPDRGTDGEHPGQAAGGAARRAGPPPSRLKPEEQAGLDRYARAHPELFVGTPQASVPFTTARSVSCPVCEGRGFIKTGTQERFCGRCGGEGRVPMPPDQVEAALAREADVALPLGTGDMQVIQEVLGPPITEDFLALKPDPTEEPRRPGVEPLDGPTVLTEVTDMETGEAIEVDVSHEQARAFIYDLPTHFEDLPPFAYIAGPAGTGKTFWAKALAANDPEACLLAATTGIAAVNLGEGTTINALLRYYNTDSLREAYTGGWLEAQLKKHRIAGLRRILLDEVSMLDGDQLTILCRAIDNVNADRAGDDPDLGLILVGDFAQLPPVKAPFAFESAEWDRFAQATATLSTIHRQADAAFIAALQAARRGDGLAALQFFGPLIQQTTLPTFDGPTILAKNEAVEKYNQLRMDTLKGAACGFVSSRWGKLRAEWGGPPKPPREWGIPEQLHLKDGARVMVLANRNVAAVGEWPEYLYTNGDLATFLEEAHGQARVVLDRTGEETVVVPITRENKIPLEVGRRKALKAEGHPERATDKHEIIGAITYLPLRLAYATTVHKCVAYGTRLVVQGRGVVPIEQVRIGDWIDTGAGTYARLKATAHTEKPVYRLTTARGYTVVCSADHRWKTNRGMQEVAHLQIGEDRVQLSPAPHADGTQEIDRDTAWWIGATVGDGNYSDRREGQIHFSNIDEALRRRWMRIAQRLGGRPNTRRDLRGCHLTNLPLRYRLALWGLDYVTAVSKRIPRAVLESGRVAWAACLQGLFDTDGGIDDHRLVFASRSTRLTRDVQHLLLLLGIPSSLGTYEGRTGTYYHVRITACGLQQYKALVGFSAPRKIALLRAWQPNRELLTFDGWDTVGAVEDLGVVMPVIDVELETIHELGFNGIVGSNSQGLSLDKVQINTRDHFFTTPGMLYVALSRCRTAEGLRIVGSAEGVRARCTVSPKVVPWL